MVYVSFVVPFYGVEKFIGQCLDSIYNQAVPETEFEVICVDDCSPDHSRDIVLQYQAKHSNLSLIINQENLRLGGARNVGFNHAKGEYVWYIDSDDKIADNCLVEFIGLLKQYKPDILAFNFRRFNNDNKVIMEGKSHPQNKSCLPGISYIKQTWGTGYVYYIMGYVWSYLYRTQYLKTIHIDFPEKVLWEDTVYAPQALFEAEKVLSTDKIGYCYRVNSQSITEIYNTSHPAEYIYQYAFVAGKDVMNFAPQIPKGELQDACWLMVKRYFNSFVIDLMRTSHKERKRFYEMVHNNWNDLQFVRPYLTVLSRCLFTRWHLWNLLAADILAGIYQIRPRS
ncbi:MAG: glycosyltransferase family 2 protein [Paludibacteraceae bacterium]|nr:glycosyltransferase family 2 protein [Paludibacteraceae bacterium]